MYLSNLIYYYSLETFSKKEVLRDYIGVMCSYHWVDRVVLAINSAQQKKKCVFSSRLCFWSLLICEDKQGVRLAQYSWLCEVGFYRNQVLPCETPLVVWCFAVLTRWEECSAQQGADAQGIQSCLPSPGALWAVSPR